METTRGWKVVVLISVLFLACSCRFKAPSTNEGQLLAKQGLFINSVPNWVKTPDDVDAASVKRDGIVPTNYGSPKVIQQTVATQPTVAIAEESKEQRDKATAQFESKRKSELKKSKGEELSPLDRIESLCPGIESDVTDALKTVDSSQRIQKYSLLTTRCPASSDLWFWLGQDYKDAKRVPEAIKAFEQVLVLDPKNQAAQALLDQVRLSGNE